MRILTATLCFYFASVLGSQVCECLTTTWTISFNYITIIFADRKCQKEYEMKLSIFKFILIRSSLTCIALLLFSSCQTTSYPRTGSDIQPISGILKVGDLKYVKARSTTTTEYIFSNSETEAGIKTTQKTATIYRNIDSNVYSFKGNIVDYNVDSQILLTQ